MHTMNMISDFIARRLRPQPEPQPQPTPAERLAATLKPCPELRARRLAQMSVERKRRYLKNMNDIQAEIGQT
jgi:hypothetical protein